jgi:hypothetical protein
MSDEPAKIPTLRLALAWGFVGIPLVWGVFQTVVKAWALFK